VKVSSDKWTNILFYLFIGLVSLVIGILLSENPFWKIIFEACIPSVLVCLTIALLTKTEPFFFEGYTLEVGSDGTLELSQIANVVLAKTPEEVAVFAEKHNLPANRIHQNNLEEFVSSYRKHLEKIDTYR